MRRGRQAGALALVCLFALLCMAPGAGASYDPLGSGATRLRLDHGFLALMQRNGIELSAVAPAKMRGGEISFPVSGGRFDPTTAKGTIEHAGTLLLRAGRRSIPLKALQLKTTRRGAPFSAKVGGSQLKLGETRSLRVSREGFGDRVAVPDLTLSRKLAIRLGKKLRLRDVFREGLPLGSTRTDAQPETVTLLREGAAELTLDPGFLAKLKSLFVAVNPIFPAEHREAPFTLPIFGGKIAPDASIGRVETQGSLEFLQLGGGQVFWAEEWLDLEVGAASPEVNVQPSPPYAGKLGRIPVGALDLTGVAVASDPRSRAVGVRGAAVAMQPETAQTFNEVFAKPQGKDGVFAAGEPLGSVSFTALGQ